MVQNCTPKQRNLSQSEVRDTSYAIKQLLKKGAVSECGACDGQFLSSYLLVQTSNRKNRFIPKLQNPNSCIELPHFKMEYFKTVIRLLVSHCYMVTIDLNDTFLLVPIADDFEKYLGFEFSGVLYQCNYLPLGLCTCPCMFTKLIKPVAHYLQVIYIDDIWHLKSNGS